MTHHTELLNLIAGKIGAKCYLEIGVYNPDHNFNKVIVGNKISVDPDPNAGAIYCITSDEYFKNHLTLFDLIFIDGLHHADQVKKDIQNAYDHLFPGGVIVIHDSNPHSEKITHVPRDNREWTGDVYKTICQIISPGFFTVDFDYGCCVIRKCEDPIQFHDDLVTWETFDAGRRSLLNLKSVEESIKIIESWT